MNIMNINIGRFNLIAVNCDAFALLIEQGKTREVTEQLRFLATCCRDIAKQEEKNNV